MHKQYVFLDIENNHLFTANYKLKCNLVCYCSGANLKTKVITYTTTNNYIYLGVL